MCTHSGTGCPARGRVEAEEAEVWGARRGVWSCTLGTVIATAKKDFECALRKAPRIDDGTA